MGLGEPGHGARARPAAGGGPAAALLRRRDRRRDVVGPLAPARGAGPPPRRVRGVGARRGRPAHPRRARRRPGDPHLRRQPRRVPRDQLRAPPRRRVPARHRPVGQLRPLGLARLGRARRRHLLQQPDGLRPASRRRPPRVAARAAEPAAGLRPGHVGGHDRARSRARARSPGGSPRRGSGTSSTCGATTSRTTGRHGERRSLIIWRGSADGTRSHPPDRPAARHRGGLAARLRDARGAARAGSGRVRRHAPDHHRADHDRAVRPHRQAALRPRGRPARLLVLRPARVAEEDRADGRRVPAQQPVHVPVDGEARRLLRDAAARAEGAADRARAAQAAARERALRVHGGEVQPAVRPRARSPRASATRCS